MTAGFGAFGKIPALGDFFRIDPPAGFVAPWDAWVQAALLAGQQHFGAQWDARYMTAPIWRFGLAAGLAGPAPVTGIVMPSVDRVGRRFPLTLVAPLPKGNVTALHFASDTLFARLEALALAALEDDMTMARLKEGLAGFCAPNPASTLTSLRRAGKTVYGIGASPLQAGMAAAFVGAKEEAQSVWTSELDGVSRMMLCSGLPGPAEIPALFDASSAAWTEEERG